MGFILSGTGRRGSAFRKRITESNLDLGGDELEESKLEAGRFMRKGLQTDGGLGLRETEAARQVYLPACREGACSHAPSGHCRVDLRIRYQVLLELTGFGHLF